MLARFRHGRKGPAQSGREGKFEVALDLVADDAVCVKKILGAVRPAVAGGEGERGLGATFGASRRSQGNSGGAFGNHGGTGAG